MKRRQSKLWLVAGIFLLAAAGLLIADFLLPGPATQSGMSLLRLMGVVAIPYVYSYRTGRQERIRDDLRSPIAEELDQSVRSTLR